jgi:hypothetical protein
MPHFGSWLHSETAAPQKTSAAVSHGYASLGACAAWR